MKVILYASLALTLIIIMPTANAGNSTIPYTIKWIVDIWVVTPILIGALLAGIVGFSVNIVYGRYKDRNDTRKLKHVLSKEFGIVYRALELTIDIQRPIEKNAESEQKAIEGRSLDPREALAGFQLMRLNSPLWNAIMSNDILFKLKKQDITMIHQTIYGIQVFDANITYLIEHTTEKLIQQPPVSGKEHLIGDCLNKLINNCMITMNLIKELDELDWFDVTKLPEYKKELLRYTNTTI